MPAPPERRPPPRQERGQRRYAEILDAAASLIEEVGTEAVTVQAISVRAGASKGSMYHFFPDRESVLIALVERHIATLRAELEHEREALAEVAAASADGAVRAFLDPVNTYVRRHPDLPRIIREPANLKRLADQSDRLTSLVETHAAWMLARRRPELDPAAVKRAATVVVAILSGLRNERVLAAAGSQEAVADEMRRVLRGYVEALGTGGDPT